jgi:hypothetical protein
VEVGFVAASRYSTEKDSTFRAVWDVVVKTSREFGGPWLGLQLVEQLGLKDSLDRTIPDGREEIPGRLMALVLILCRRCVTQPTDYQAILLTHLKLKLPKLPLTGGVW